MSVFIKEDFDGGDVLDSIDFDQLTILGGINGSKPEVLTIAFLKSRVCRGLVVFGHPFLTVWAPGDMEGDHPDRVGQVHHFIPILLSELCIGRDIFASKNSCEEHAQNGENEMQFHNYF